MQVIVFASNDIPEAAEARELARAIRGRFIDRLSNQMPDLLLVARYRVTDPVTIIIHTDAVVHARIPRLTTYEELLRTLAGAAT